MWWRPRLTRAASQISSLVLLLLIQAIAAADKAPVPLLKRLDEPTKAKVLAALAGLIILGFGMVALIWLGARVTQRYRKGTSFFRPTPRPGEHDWAKKPLAAPDEPNTPPSDL
jgi:hypothetical protein